MWPLIKLTRPLNLLIVVYTMYAMRYGVIGTLIEPAGFTFQFPNLQFALLVLSVVLIAAAGNVINDYFDSKIDTINKPEEVIVGFGVTRRQAMAAHLVMSLMGLALGTYLAWSIGHINLAGIHLFCSATLWYYSSVFKRQFLLGNVVVALLAALVPLMVALYELPLLSLRYSEDLVKHFQSVEQANFYIKIIYYWVLGFAGFAFLLNLIREIVKDFADIPGDREQGRATLPLVLGYQYTNIALTLLVLITAAMVTWVYVTQIEHIPSLAYFAVFFYLPLASVLFIVWRYPQRNGYIRAGHLVKVVMIAGVTYSFLIKQMLNT